ncbi:MAG: hypothetical protein M3P49_16530 [Actinomycetota bacterium]|nr:hypothetical protein [Actinomycetota bacterium]
MPPVDPDGDFQRGLRVILALLREKAARILIGTGPQLVQLELLDDHPRFRQVVEAEGMPAAALDGVGNDVAEILAALLRGYTLDELVGLRTRDTRSLERQESEEVARHKAEAVLAAFDRDPLERRFWLKRTSSALIPTVVSWEIGLKHGDADGAPPGQHPVPYATLKLVAEPAHAYVPTMNEQEITVVLDLEDIGYLQDSLRRLGAALSRIEQEDGQA